MAEPRLQCRRGTPGPVAADVNGSFWPSVKPITLRETVGGGVPRQGTRARTAWDDKTWRILFDSDDTRPWATLTVHDAPLWTEETVEVFVDPVGDLAGYFEIEINPLGTVVDLFLRRISSGWRKDFDWHVDGLESKARIIEKGWVAELAIPFEALGAAVPQAGTLWRANFMRIDRPGGPGSEPELCAWSPTGMRNFHRAASFGTVEFVS